MFKKVQLRFFSIIVCILLAIFIALLGAVNLIMHALMERQSTNVLEQVAAGVEYDETKNPPFTFIRPEDDKEHKYDVPPEKPTGEPGNDGPSMPASTEASTQETVPATTAAQTTVTAPKTETEPENIPPEEEPPPEELPPEDVPPEEMTAAEPPKTEPPKTEPPKTEPATKEPEEPEEPSEPKDPDDDDRPEMPTGWWWQWGGDERPERPDDGGWRPGFDGGGWQPMAYMPGVDSGGGIVQLSAAPQTTAPASSASTEKKTTATTSSLPNSNSSMPANSQNGDPGMNAEQKNKNPNAVPRSLGTIDFFIIMADQEGNYLATLNNDDMTEELAQKYITEILKSDLKSGMVNNQYQFLAAEKSNGTLIVFTDKSPEMDMLQKLFRTTIFIGLISIIVLSIASYFLSGLIVKPIKEAFSKQKQFISDASHELKTPLTVISANADVLKGEIGENKWLTYITDQADKMNVLVNELLNLTRLENNTAKLIFANFDLSQAIENTALPFECQAFEMNRKFELDIEEGLDLVGSEQHIKQMAAIFIDNALKYSNEGGTVRVGLKKQGDKRVLSVFNTGSGVKEADKERIFERFFRSDESRNRASGSYGLGLAIAKSIIDKHRFKINVDNEEGKSICFVVTM